MERRSGRGARAGRAAVVAAAVAVMTVRSGAATRAWQPADGVGGSWFDAASWSGAAVPTSFDGAVVDVGRVEVSEGTAVALGITLASVAAGNGKMVVSGGKVGPTGLSVGVAGSGRVEQSGGVVTPKTLDLGVNAGSSGVYALGGTGAIDWSGSYSGARVGVNGFGEVLQEGGRAGGGDLTLGAQVGGVGSYRLTGGSLTVGTARVGETGRGGVKQTGGQFAPYTLLLGAGAGGTGSYELCEGAFLNSDATVVGYGSSSSGTFVQSGGVHVASYRLTMAVGSGSRAAYSLSGTAQLSVAQEERWGDGGKSVSTFTQAGGTHAVGGPLYMGIAAGSLATYSLSGNGNLSVTGVLAVGGAGTGVFEQAGGTVNAREIQVAGNSSYRLRGQGVLTAGTTAVGFYGTGSFDQSGGSARHETMYVGQNTGANGRYTLSGAGSVLAVLKEYIGYAGAGSFEQLGGMHLVLSYQGGSAGELHVGYQSGSVGSYVLGEAGILISGGDEHVGYSGVGSFMHDGAAVNNLGQRTLSLGTQGGGIGSYFLAGDAVLIAGGERIGPSGTGLFRQTGGTNLAGTLVIGTKGRYEMLGGVLEISGALTNAGTLSVDHAGPAVVTVGTTIANDGSIVVTRGDVRITAGNVTGNVVGKGTITLNGPAARLEATSVAQSSITISAGRVELATRSAPSMMGALTIGPGGAIDIADDAFVIDYAAASPVEAVRKHLLAGYAGGVWDGMGGIVSSAAAGMGAAAVGYGEWADVGARPAGVSPVGAALLLRCTWYGDANLDGVVNQVDAGMMSAAGTTWAEGDFNYDGKVSADDWALMGLGAAAQTGRFPVALPDPGTWGGVTSGTSLLGLRRRRRTQRAAPRISGNS